MKKLIFVLLPGLAACSQSLDHYQLMEPQFDIAAYFDGPLIAHGMLQQRNGELTRRFCVEIIGEWEGNEGTLYEEFYFADGERQQRIWSLTKQEDGSVQGQADDVVGMAVGYSQGPAFHWKYTLTIPVDGKTYDVKLDDWLYQMDDDHLFNRATINKFGLRMADLTLFFDKSPGSLKCQPETS